MYFCFPVTIEGYAGSIHSLENELEEIQWIQQQYIKILAAETDMTQKYIKNLISRKVNVYLTAEQAVEYGIADEVF
jgi:ATP-dependent protease ClpP protease subunit